MAWDLIPQVFYDVIVRIMPGFVSIVAWYLTILGPNQAIRNLTEADQNIFSLGSSAWLIVFSYILGFILKELWDLTFKRLKRGTTIHKAAFQESIDEYNQHRKCFGKLAVKLQSQDLPEDVHVMHDYIRVYLPIEGHRLLKLRAERNLCGTLFTGLFFPSIVNILPYYQPLTSDRVFLEIAMIAALVVSWIANSELEKLYTHRTCRSWLSLCFPVGPLKQKLAGKP